MRNKIVDSSQIARKKYKAYFVGINEDQKQTFKHSKCLMLISVGQKYHEDGELLAAIKLVSKHFAFCNILVCDTLQRHSFRALHDNNKSDEELYNSSMKAGDEWIERNIQPISSMSIPYVISRWDEWIKNNRFKFYYQKVLYLYNEDPNYKEIVDQVANEFINRKRLFEHENHMHSFNCCINYLLEESAVACLWVELGYKFDVYPTRSNLAMITAYTKLVPEDLNIGAQSLRLNIKKISDRSLNQLKTEEFKNIATNYILTHAPGHIYWKNLDGVFLGCNVEHARYFGFKNPIDIIGKINEDFLDEETARHITEVDNEVMRTGKEHVIEECVNGTQYFLSKKIALRNYDNEIIGLLGTSINITEQKNLKINLQKTVNELEAALDSKGRFIKNMNHEIRIPMQFILNGAQILKDNFWNFDDEKKLYFLDGMIKATKRLDDFVRNLLDMSKFKEGKFVLNKEIENFETLVEEIIQEFSFMYSNTIDYSNSFPGSIFVMCDKIRIQQVLRNLLLNSIKCSLKSETLFIFISEHFDEGVKYLKFTLKDQGIGVPNEERESIFQPFVEGSKTINMPGGIGLGLAISKEIIIAHGGRIWVDDLLDGETGCRMTFILPINS